MKGSPANKPMSLAKSIYNHVAAKPLASKSKLIAASAGYKTSGIVRLRYDATQIYHTQLAL